MAATIEVRAAATNAEWLKRQTPVWLSPTLAVLAALEAAIIIAQAALIAWIAGAAFIERIPLDALMPGMWALLGVLALRAIAGGVRQYVAAAASARVRERARAGLLETIESAGPAAIESSGALIPVFDEQVDALDRYYARFLPQRMAATIVPLTVLGFVVSSDWLAGALLALSAPLIPLFMILIGLGAERLAGEQNRSLAALSGWFLDQLQGAATIRLFMGEQAAVVAVARRTDSLRQQTMRVLKLALLSSAVLEFFAAVAIASVAIYVGLGLFGAIEFGPAPDLTLRSGLFVLLLAPEFFQPLRALAQGWHDRADAMAAAQGIHQVTRRPACRPRADPDFSPSPPNASRVRIHSLYFGHPGRGALFEGLELVIPAGQRLVLTGPSGGGKSTLISLLAGFAEPDAGRILLDGQPLTRFSAAARAAHVAWLGQRPWLFAGTIADNIALGWVGADRQQIEDAARRARVCEFTDHLPDGLDTAIGAGGLDLSGGQAQRVALARAIVRSRPLLLLDEPTAGLDPDSEAQVLAALGCALQQRSVTVVCAGHRPATMAWADRVLRVEHGRVSEVRR